MGNPNGASKAMNDSTHCRSKDSEEFLGGRLPSIASAAEITQQHELDQFLARYGRGRRKGEARPPDLQDSLEALASEPGANKLFAGLPASVCCLIQGYAGPGNARALREFLSAAGVVSVDIVAVDTYDLPAAFARLGFVQPEMRFCRADACDLSQWAADGSFDLIVQDFLLNCLPPLRHADLLAEAARLLHPGGLAIISFTDDIGARALPPIHSERILASHGTEWNPHATCLSQLSAVPAIRSCLKKSLIGQVVEDSATGGLTLVTAPNGYFEYFIAATRTRAAIEAAGFKLLVEQITDGLDDHGLRCTRHRCIAHRC